MYYYIKVSYRDKHTRKQQQRFLIPNNILYKVPLCWLKYTVILLGRDLYNIVGWTNPVTRVDHKKDMKHSKGGPGLAFIILLSSFNL